MLPWVVCFPPTALLPLSATFSFPPLLTLPSLPSDDGPSHLKELTPPALAPFVRYGGACSAPGAGFTWPWDRSGVHGWLVRRPRGWVAATTASRMTRAVAASRCGGEGPSPPDLWRSGRRSLHGDDGARLRGRGARGSSCGGLASGASAVKTEMERQRGRVWRAGVAVAEARGWRKWGMHSTEKEAPAQRSHSGEREAGGSGEETMERTAAGRYKTFTIFPLEYASPTKVLERSPHHRHLRPQPPIRRL